MSYSGYHGKHSNRDAYSFAEIKTNKPRYKTSQSSSTQSEQIPHPLDNLRKGKYNSSFSDDIRGVEDNLNNHSPYKNSNNRLSPIQPKQQHKKMRDIGNESMYTKDSSTSAIPENLKQNFRIQMENLLNQNETLGHQVTMMKENRGVRIDEEQFKSWESKIDNLRGEVEASNDRKVALERENIQQAEIIATLENDKRELVGVRGELEDALDTARSKHRRELKIAEQKPTVIVGTIATQTKHTGVIPEKPKLKPATTARGVMTEERTTVDVMVQCDPPPPPKPSPRRQIPAASEEEIDTAILMGELNEIRQILETTPNDNSTATAWEEVKSHGVLSILCSLKQRAKMFRVELDLARRRKKDREIGEARRGSSSFRRKEIGQAAMFSPEREKAEEVEVAPAQLKIMDFGGVDGARREATEKRKNSINNTKRLPSMADKIASGEQRRSSRRANTGGGRSAFLSEFVGDANKFSGNVHMVPSRPKGKRT